MGKRKQTLEKKFDKQQVQIAMLTEKLTDMEEQNWNEDYDESDAVEPPPKAAPGALKQQTTVMTQAAKKGDTILHVHSTKGLKVGQKIRIGKIITEEAVIKSFGSIHLEGPLLMDHSVGEEVVVVDSTTRIR